MNNEEKKSNKLYWILGGIAALVLIGGFVLVLAAGVGIYLYSGDGDEVAKNANSRNDTAEESKTPEKKSTDELGDLFPDTGESSGEAKPTNEKIAAELKRKGNIGDFRLVNAATQDSLTKGSKRVFALSEASAYATYTDVNAPNENSIAMFAGVYESEPMAKLDFLSTKNNTRKSGATNVKDATKGKILGATMDKGKWKMYLTCNKKTCYFVTASNQVSLNKFVAAMTGS